MLSFVHARCRGSLTARNMEDEVLTGPTLVAPEMAATGVSKSPTLPPLSSEALLERVVASLTDDKAEDIVQIDLRGKSSVADYVVIASGRSTRQVAALSENLVERLKIATGTRCKMEGKGASDWVLIDAGDVIIHVFRPEVREFYQLEKIWMPAAAAPPR